MKKITKRGMRILSGPRCGEYSTNMSKKFSIVRELEVHRFDDRVPSFAMDHYEAISDTEVIYVGTEVADPKEK